MLVEKRCEIEVSLLRKENLATSENEALEKNLGVVLFDAASMFICYVRLSINTTLNDMIDKYSWLKFS